MYLSLCSQVQFLFEFDIIWHVVNTVFSVTVSYDKQKGRGTNNVEEPSETLKSFWRHSVAGIALTAHRYDFQIFGKLYPLAVSYNREIWAPFLFYLEQCYKKGHFKYLYFRL